jgi:8-amino-7-oxononanoate synthase
MTALDLMLRQSERVEALRANGARFLSAAKAQGLACGDSWGAAVAPVLIGDSLLTVLLSERLIARGFVAVPVIPPGVPEKHARLRFFLSAAHNPADIDAAVAALADEAHQLKAAGVSLASVAGQAIAQRMAGAPGG